MDEDGQHFVIFGEPFDEDDDEKSRFSNPKSRPQAYEQRVLNERGRPMRFHGAFTGGFSAGYFNTVGSREGFQPQSFTSSRRNRTQNAPQLQGKPEDYMDEEDFGVFGIAPRHYRTRREFDDRHIFDTLSESLGGKSVIPAADDILKRMLIPSGVSLADKLLRRMGWKSEDIAEVVAENDAEESVVFQGPKERDYALISFAPKTNTFGLGYSGLDPEIAFGRRAPTSIKDPRAESVSSLQRCEKSSHVGFNPSTGPIRQGIRGQAFGVGALHTEDADIYAEDSLTIYDFSIAPGQEEEEADDEMAELEAARHGRLSDLRKSKPSNSTLDGWTPPTLPKISLSGVEEHDKTDEIEGFVRPVNSSACLVLASSEFFVIPKTVHLPPGYNPVFHPHCLGGDAVEEAGQGHPSIPEVFTAPLLKPFVGDSAKQARFEAYQLLVRQGLSHEEAYGRCSCRTPDLTAETRVFEANVFATLVKNLKPPSREPSKTSQPSQTPAIPPHEASEQKQERDNRPLTAGILDEEKQRLVANILKSRFRSAGEMDVTQELTAAQEEERRKDLESLDMTDPRDNAAANEAYGILTRRTLTWHPAALLCKRFNVPNPYPDSTFVGCPEDNRLRRPSRRNRKRRGDDITSGEFTLSQLLDMNVGGRDGDNGGSEYSDETDEEAEKAGEEVATPGLNSETSVKPLGGPPENIFDALFVQSEKAQWEKESEKTESAPVNPTPRILGPAAPPLDISKAPTVNEEGAPSMDLFKSIFASDEELEDDDDDGGQKNADLAALLPPPPAYESLSTEFRPSVVSADPIQQDELEKREDEEKAKEIVTLSANPPDLTVHQLFKHLFNTEMDCEGPLFAVSKVTNQRREKKSMEVDSNSAVLNPSKSPVSEEDFYGPSLPPGFGEAGGSNISTSISVNSTNSSSNNVEYVERKKRKKDNSDREHNSHKHKSKLRHHHKHKHRHHSKRDKN